MQLHNEQGLARLLNASNTQTPTLPPCHLVQLGPKIVGQSEDKQFELHQKAVEQEMAQRLNAISSTQPQSLAPPLLPRFVQIPSIKGRRKSKLQPDVIGQECAELHRN